jgi:hypothetical protein
MPELRWEKAADACGADSRAADIFAEGLSVNGWRIDRKGRLFARGPVTRVQFGWGAGHPDVRVAAGPPFGSAVRPTRMTVVPDQALGLLLTEQGAAGSIAHLPYPVPDPFFDWSDAGPVFQVTRGHRLQARPRLVVAGDWRLGHALTRVLPAARRVLSAGGELVLLDALGDRARIAPAVAAMGLQEAAVFLPPLADTELAGLFHSADLFMQADVHGGYPALMRWALASGLPAVGIDDPLTRRAAEHSFVAVDPSRNDVWPEAVAATLDDGRLREEIIRRAAQSLDAARLSRVVPALTAILQESGGGGP